MIFKKVISLVVFCMMTATAGHAAEEPAKKTADTPPSVEAPGLWPTLFSLDPMKEKAPEEKRWFLTIGGWYERKLGNTDTMRSNGSFSLEYKNGIAELVLTYLQLYSEQKDETIENNGSGLIKYDHYLFSWLEFFLFNQTDYNTITGLRLRNGSGAGVKFVFFRNKYWLLDLSAAPVVEYQKYTTEDYTVDYRASFRGRVKINIMDMLSLTGTVFFIPQLDDFDNYRFVVDTAAVLSVIGNAADKQGLSLKAGYKRTYNTYVLPGKQKLDEVYYLQAQLHL